MTVSANGCRIDVADIKARCRGRWPEVLAAVCGIDRQLLDGRNHPCPLCDGTDRFRMIDIEAGALFCNQCFNHNNGDGIAAVRWLMDVDFPTACERIAEYLHVLQTHGRAHGSNGMTPRKSKTSRKFGNWEEAVADTEQRMGKLSTESLYRDRNGQLVGVVCRWDTSTGKEIRQFAEQADGSWMCTAMQEPRPLYRLPEVQQSTGRIWIVEGEKSADALRRIGLTATTSSGGAQAAKKSDWSALAGREVIIWPDHDEPGAKYRDDVLAMLELLDSRPIVRCINPSKLGLMDKGDAADWLDARDAQRAEELVAELNAIAAAAPVVMQAEVENRPRILSTGNLVEQYPTLRPVVVDGLLRQGEICNIIAKSKVGKSWLGYGLALSVATGRHWLGRFACSPGRVLLIDNELHPEVIAGRVPAVAEAMGLRPEEYRDHFDVLSLRGRLTPIDRLGEMLRNIEQGHYALIILDALYRMLPGGCSENDNAAMAQVYNQLDRLATQTGAAFVCIHHASKGDQSNKDVTDVGSGAGAQSRAADTHLVIRPHADDGAAVLEAAVRSFPPVERLGIRWEHPLWFPDKGLDTERLKRSTTVQEQRQAERDREGFDAIVDALRASEPMTVRSLRSATGYGVERVKRLVDSMELDGRLVGDQTVVKGNPTTEYRLANHLQDT